MAHSELKLKTACASLYVRANAYGGSGVYGLPASPARSPPMAVGDGVTSARSIYQHRRHRRNRTAVGGAGGNAYGGGNGGDGGAAAFRGKKTLNSPPRIYAIKSTGTAPLSR